MKDAKTHKKRKITSSDRELLNYLIYPENNKNIYEVFLQCDIFLTRLIGDFLKVYLIE